VDASYLKIVLVIEKPRRPLRINITSWATEMYISTGRRKRRPQEILSESLIASANKT